MPDSGSNSPCRSSSSSRSAVARRFGTEPIFLTVGVFTGAGAAFYSMYRGLMADQRKAEQEKEDQKKRDRQGPGAGMGQS